MCLPLQLSPGDSPYILLFRPDIQNRHMHICKHISSTYAFFPLPLIAGAIQPSARGVSSSVLSQLSHCLQSCTSHNISLSFPGHCCHPPTNSSLRALYGLPSGPHGRSTFLRKFHRALSFDFFQGRAEVHGV